MEEKKREGVEMKICSSSWEASCPFLSLLLLLLLFLLPLLFPLFPQISLPIFHFVLFPFLLHFTLFLLHSFSHLFSKPSLYPSLIAFTSFHFFLPPSASFLFLFSSFLPFHLLLSPHLLLLLHLFRIVCFSFSFSSLDQVSSVHTYVCECDNSRMKWCRRVKLIPLLYLLRWVWMSVILTWRSRSCFLKIFWWVAWVVVSIFIPCFIYFPFSIKVFLKWLLFFLSTCFTFKFVFLLFFPYFLLYFLQSFHPHAFPSLLFSLTPFFSHSPPTPSLLSSSLQGRLYYKGWICILIHFFQFFQIRRCQHISVLIKLPHPPETWLCSCISVRGCACVCVCVLGELPPETKKNKDLQQREKQVAF